ncbi:tautomerase family protein [Pseudomonas sp. 5P_3.1_Bac2]|uniref:tautomerase family protein n=1 Tax=Pseudomonas sp. 5P_3.1_Bac2 TaxID=2971617 RepID=UPI0021C72E59|nr:4-oxalocrotonate tautomerase family protein [Pseudomonas sp. 5P_3.1_Bac2]MCU1719590.1 4-oxalocrotonate tautomerase family protein [Pseudomonas sp. 5P_3.1_Bac2]
MPFITLRMTPGASREQKAQVVKEFTETLERVLDKKPEWTSIVIEEIATENWAVAGQTLRDQQEQQAKG